jgi:TonB-dependent SusC/RagA subfamily outer membrane receptor
MFCFAAIAAYSQQSIRDARQKSWQTFVYRISADSAQYYIKKTLANPDQFLNQAPFLVWQSDSLKYDELPPGNYIILDVKETELRAEYYCQSNIRPMPLNNQHRVQLEVKDLQGNLLVDARLWANNKEVKYDPATQSFIIPEKKPDEMLIKIAIPGDTLFMELWAKEDVEKGSWSQWWKNFSYTKSGKIITWPVRAVRTMFKQPIGKWIRKKRKNTRLNNGYIVFNKPKYLPGDTVKFKAYVLNKKYKQVKYPLDFYLDFYSNGKSDHKKMATLKPVSPSSFIYEFVLGDSLDIDRSYIVTLIGKKNTTYIRGYFTLEDYLLDEVATYNLRSQQDKYFPKDSIVFYTSAKDANGLSLMDGKARLYLITNNVFDFYKEKEFVPDTLWQGEKTMLVNEETKFTIPTDSFPDANITIKALVQFRNSNNEMQEKETTVDYIAQSKTIQVKQSGAFIHADYMVNGKSVNMSGFMEEGDEAPEKIMFPFSQKINPYANEYTFSIKNSTGKNLHVASQGIDHYRIVLNRMQQKDTAGFSFYNPYRIPVHYTVFDGGKLLAAGADSTEWIYWKKVLPLNKSYRVQWNYIWANEEEKNSETIALLDKILQTNISGAETIYPGQKDTITVTINDYKGNPAEEVNLTAVSYNSQFKDAIRIQEPPYLQQFKGRRRILFDSYDLEDVGFTKQFILGKYQGWRRKFGLDSMLYYQFLFPKDSFIRKVEPVVDFFPQAAIHIVKEGVPQEIYMLYINREFAYYNGVTDKSNYVFSVFPGYTQVGIRTRDKYIVIDSIYMQPSYKHDIVFDLNKLPVKARVTEMPAYFTNDERQVIENNIWQLQNDPRTNNGYIWQGNRLFYIGNTYRHLIGPFNPYDSLQFFKPGDFDFKFPFEKGYEYRLTPKMARLERKNIFNATYQEKIFLPTIQKVKWQLGDTLAVLPVIEYNKKNQRLFTLQQTDDQYYKRTGKALGTLRVKMPADSNFIYTILYNILNPDTPLIKTYNFENFYNLAPGTYRLILVTKNYHFISTGNIELLGGGLNCIQFFNPAYTISNDYVNGYLKQREEAEKKLKEYLTQKENINNKKYPEGSYFGKNPVSFGNGYISGFVRDKKGGEPIKYATVHIKGTTTGTSTAMDGSYKIQKIKAGRFTLVFSSIGYYSKEFTDVSIDENGSTLDVFLEVSEQFASEVVVTAFGVVRSKKELGFSISKVSGMELTSGLSGKVSGLNVTNWAQDISDSTRITLRGISSVSGDSKPLYVINGVLVDELPPGFDMTKAKVDILNGQSAVALYGSRAANGVILITSADFMPKTLRDKFSDYAFWQPDLFTDKDGKVKFAVTYPDNITSWQTFVVGMDKKRRLTKASFFTKAFKPLLAQLATPQFLIEGDSAVLIGKSINYTSNSTGIKTEFKINNITGQSAEKELAANASHTDDLIVRVTGTDTLQAQYLVTNTNGYSDGELRKIPVYRKGIEEAIGSFQVLENDTTFVFTPDADAGSVTFHAQNNTLEILLDEIKHLKEYPYSCMEQMASKLTGLLMEQKIKQALKMPFENEKELKQLLSKLQKAQLFDGGWSWWQGGGMNLSITNYVTQALLPLRQDPVVESSIRNALLYLQNRLPLLKRDELLSALFTLSEAGHYMNFTDYLSKVPFDSISLHQQWQVIKIRQEQKLDYEKELNHVFGKKTETMFGGVHWGVDNYYWESNSMATTALAFSVLERDEKYKPLLKQIIQFFLEQRKEGRWRNTVESAKTVAAILPTILLLQPDFNSSTTLNIQADKNLIVNKFPFSYTTSNSMTSVKVSKSGGGLVYFTAWQKIFNKNPEPVSDKFLINTWFERNGTGEAILTAGEKTTMKIKVDVLKDADYVQIEIPIPAGCTYSEKKQDNWQVYKEFFKNKVVMFSEKMNKGVYHFEIELEPRYAGKYQLNPAKGELMYFPIFYGRNEMKTVEIK